MISKPPPSASRPSLRASPDYTGSCESGVECEAEKSRHYHWQVGVGGEIGRISVCLPDPYCLLVA